MKDSTAQRQQSEAAIALDSGAAHQGQLAGLVSMRMVVLFNRMRRSTILTQRRAFNLSEIEWRIMTTMSEGQTLSLNGIAEQLMQDRGQLSRAVKGMVQRGLLTRIRKPGGPEVEIGLAPGGLELHEKMVERAIERDIVLTEGIDAADIAAMRRVIEQMLVRADKLVEAAIAVTDKD